MSNSLHEQVFNFGPTPSFYVLGENCRLIIDIKLARLKRVEEETGRIPVVYAARTSWRGGDFRQIEPLQGLDRRLFTFCVGTETPLVQDALQTAPAMLQAWKIKN